MEQTECCLGGIRLSGVLRPKQVASVGAQTKSRAWPCGLAHRVPRASPMRAASGCLHLQFRIILHYVPDFQPRTMILLPGTRNILPTKVTRKDAKKQHGSKPNHMRQSVTWFVASRLEARGVRRRIRARIAQFRPTCCPSSCRRQTTRLVWHTLRHDRAVCLPCRILYQLSLASHSLTAFAFARG